MVTMAAARMPFGRASGRRHAAALVVT